MDTFGNPAEVRRATPWIDKTNGNGSHLSRLPHPFLSLAAPLLALCLLFSPSARGAGLAESFSDSGGFRTDISGGAWQKFYSQFVGDAQVSSGLAVLDDTTDGIRTFPAVLATRQILLR